MTPHSAFTFFWQYAMRKLSICGRACMQVVIRSKRTLRVFLTLCRHLDVSGHSAPPELKCRQLNLLSDSYCRVVSKSHPRCWRQHSRNESSAPNASHHRSERECALRVWCGGHTRYAGYCDGLFCARSPGAFQAGSQLLF